MMITTIDCLNVHSIRVSLKSHRKPTYFAVRIRRLNHRISSIEVLNLLERGLSIESTQPLIFRKQKYDQIHTTVNDRATIKNTQLLIVSGSVHTLFLFLY